MMTGTYTNDKGEVVESIIIGHFLVVPCCPTFYAVMHEPSNTRVVCSLSKDHALMVADTISIHAKDEPKGTTMDEVMNQVGHELASWAVNFDGMPYKQWLELAPADRPRKALHQLGISLMVIKLDELLRLAAPKPREPEKQN